MIMNMQSKLVVIYRSTKQLLHSILKKQIAMFIKYIRQRTIKKVIKHRQIIQNFKGIKEETVSIIIIQNQQKQWLNIGSLIKLIKIIPKIKLQLRIKYEFYNFCKRIKQNIPQDDLANIKIIIYFIITLNCTNSMKFIILAFTISTFLVNKVQTSSSSSSQSSSLLDNQSVSKTYYDSTPSIKTQSSWSFSDFVSSSSSQSDCSLGEWKDKGHCQCRLNSCPINKICSKNKRCEIALCFPECATNFICEHVGFGVTNCKCNGAICGANKICTGNPLACV